ncbi:T9SS type A sorting domain-containing protein, partial [Dyadobacter sp. CY343]|uniref:T9SS type A sorting domain-containing protein n=1 Tax=Dyadobacter sp. CY343 TaxID=2907299 RepID=UPI001F2683D7
AKKFIQIATVNASGSGDHQYSYVDQNQYNGTVYYRLKMSDLDETYTYSKIISLTGEGNLTSIYPNPAGEAVIFQVNNALLKTTATLHDISGRKLQSILITNDRQEINVKSLASGFYILKFADGSAERFVKE